jgi:hypothetical protein
MKHKRPAIFWAGFACAAAVVSTGCADNASGPDNGPAFSNPTKLNTAVYVSYPLIDPARLKLDTLKLSFNCNSSKVKSIKVDATLDSARTWIAVATITPGGSNKASVTWIPKDAAQTTFNYFGFKDCYIRIRNPETDSSITTDTFKVIGSVPFVLIAPIGGETYNKSDSLKVLYSQNKDRTAQITVCAKAGPDSIDWAKDIGITVQISKVLPIYNYSTTFVPQELALDRPGYFDLSMPLQLLLADYGPNGKRILSRNITIQ